MLGRMLLRFPARSRLSRPGGVCSLIAQAPTELAPRATLTIALRTYATPGRPKSVVGEPSRPVKRGVKKAAAKPADGTSAAEKKIAAKKVAAKKKKPAAKPNKKELTPEQQQRLIERKAAQDGRRKERRQKEKDKATLAGLKAAALEPPKQKQYSNTWNVFVAEQLKNQPRPVDISKVTRDLSAQWKALGPADQEHYNHLFHTANQTQEAEYARWVESLSAEQIRQANKARATLRRKGSKFAKYKDIQDPRRVKRPASPYAIFSSNRHASGDLNKIKLSDFTRLIAQEWKALNEGEKEKYRKLAQQDASRYAEEFERVYGHSPKQVSAAA